MAMAPWVYTNAAKACRFHLQVKIDQVGPDGGVQARVVRIFRGDDAIRIDDIVAFTVPIRERDDGPPGSHYLVASRLRQANFLELFLDGEPPNFGSVGFLIPLILEAPSDTPVTKLLV